VAAELGYLPLALAQAAAVITAQHLGYGTYLGKLHGMPVGDLLRPVELGQYPRGVASAVLLSLQGVRAADDTGMCMAVMALLAVLSTAGVRRTLVREAARQGVMDEDGKAGELAADVADQALGRLGGASLLTFSMDGSSVSAHRLVMRVIREQLAAEDSITSVCAVAAGSVLRGLADSLDQTWYQDRAAARDLVEQITALSESSAACPADSSLVHRVLSLRSRAVFFLHELNESPVRSILIAEPLLAEMDRVLGADDPGTQATRHNLAAAYRDTGRLTEAITLDEQNLADRERMLGSDAPLTLTTRNNLALAYRYAGRLAEAITLHEQTLVDMERVLGADHPDTLTTRNNLTLAYQEADRSAEAITLHEQTLAARERVLGADHPRTLRSRHNLAGAYRAAGRLTEAITLDEQNLAERERVLGASHPDTRQSLDTLADSYLAVGRTAEAIALREQILADMERVLGADHPETLQSRNNLAAAYQKAGHSAEDTSAHGQPGRPGKSAHSLSIRKFP
jgi:tetratricopeptide (TPR) repeat protein